MDQLWRVAPEMLKEAQDDAAAVVIRELKQAGIDIVTDGEVRRESYSNHFIVALDGIDVERPEVIRDHRGNETVVPRVVGEIKRRGPVELEALAFLREKTDRPVKVTLPGPFTLAQQALRRVLTPVGRVVATSGVLRNGWNTTRRCFG